MGRAAGCGSATRINSQWLKQAGRLAGSQSQLQDVNGTAAGMHTIARQQARMWCTLAAGMAAGSAVGMGAGWAVAMEADLVAEMAAGCRKQSRH